MIMFDTGPRLVDDVHDYIGLAHCGFQQSPLFAKLCVLQKVQVIGLGGYDHPVERTTLASLVVDPDPFVALFDPHQRATTMQRQVLGQTSCQRRSAMPLPITAME